MPSSLSNQTIASASPLEMNFMSNVYLNLFQMLETTFMENKGS
jgi:hypothetical protein